MISVCVQGPDCTVCRAYRAHREGSHCGVCTIGGQGPPNAKHVHCCDSFKKHSPPLKGPIEPQPLDFIWSNHWGWKFSFSVFLPLAFICRGTPILPRLNTNTDQERATFSPRQLKLWTAVWHCVPPTWLPKSSFINIIFNSWIEVPQSLFSPYLGNLLRLNPTCSPRDVVNGRKRHGMRGGPLFSGFFHRNSPLTYYLSFWSSMLKDQSNTTPAFVLISSCIKLSARKSIINSEKTQFQTKMGIWHRNQSLLVAELKNDALFRAFWDLVYFLTC